MRVIVAGGRNFYDKNFVYKNLNELHIIHQFTTLIHGNATGVDYLAEQWAADNNIPIESFPADWKKYGRAAGPIRNQKMLENNPNLLIAFPGSKGTKNIVKKAIELGVATIEIKMI